MTALLEVSVSFGSWLRRARERRGLNTTDLAIGAGVSQPLITAYEKGTRSPKRQTVKDIATALLPEEADEESAREFVDEALMAAGFMPEWREMELVREPDPDREALIGFYEGLTPGGKKRVVDLAAYVRELEKESAFGGTGEPKKRPQETTDEEARGAGNDPAKN